MAHIETRPTEERGAREQLDSEKEERSKSSPRRLQNQLSRNLPETRAMWWRLRSQGVALPAERDVILIDDGWWQP